MILEPKTQIEKMLACISCYKTDDCICNCESIKLEFEVCSCCGRVVSAGCPANTKFNTQQITDLKNRLAKNLKS